jgi:hypothetical protein
MSYTKEGWYYDGKGRTCTKCGEYKSWDEFYATDEGVNNKKSKCKSCIKKKFNKQRKENKHISYERLVEVLNYDTDIGIFTWKAKINTTTVVGNIAGHKDKLGYITIRIDGKTFKSHRLAWLYVYKIWPEKFLDHINRNPSDNRICNLREISRRGNAINKMPKRISKSGIVGVYLSQSAHRWYALVTVRGKDIFLGSSPSKIEAAKLRRKGEIEYGYINYKNESSALDYILKHEPDYIDE